jgi:hypothetical protein
MGAATASLVVAQLLCILHGATPLQLLNRYLQWPEHRHAAMQRNDSIDSK